MIKERIEELKKELHVLHQVVDDPVQVGDVWNCGHTNVLVTELGLVFLSDGSCSAAEEGDILTNGLLDPRIKYIYLGKWTWVGKLRYDIELKPVEKDR